MEEISQEKIQKTTINIQDLESEAIDLHLGEVEQREGEFRSTKIKAPEDMTFDPTAKRVTLEGFTEGAIKNILMISNELLRVFRVTEGSIELVSCFPTPSCSFDLREAKYISNQQKCSFQAFPEKGNSTLIIKLDSASGALLDAREANILENGDQTLEKTQKFFQSKSNKSKGSEAYLS